MNVVKNVVYWLIHIDFQIQEIFPERVANPINKRFATRSGNISCIWKSMWISLYLSYDVASESVMKPCVKNDNQLVD